MTTEARHRGVLLVAVVLVSVLPAACAGGREERRGDTVDVSTYPPEIQRAYHVFALRCSRCHTLARPLNAHIHDPQHWIRYVRRMRRQPGSGIDQTNADLILTFLLYYHRPPTPPTEEAAPEAPAPPPVAPQPAEPEPSAPAAAPPVPAPEPAAPEPPELEAPELPDPAMPSGATP